VNLSTAIVATMEPLRNIQEWKLKNSKQEWEEKKFDDDLNTRWTRENDNFVRRGGCVCVGE